MTTQGQNMGEEKKYFKSYNVQKYEKIKYNFNVETINLKIDKALLKLNMLLHYMLNSLLTSTIHTTTHYW